ncbi:MAG: dUTP diphosphatase [Muribaculaceae bacterium]|jgi:dUTP pyrophosphatase|nr:dUTP diphosphatase [Muribaculaceae bacterium]
MIDKVEVKIVNKSTNALPHYSTEQSAGMDLRAWLKEPVTLQPMERTLIPTGIYIELPPGYECQIRPRSGLALKRGLTVLNSPGTIDADYRGEVCVILANLSNEPQTIENGERVCQMVVAKHSTVQWQLVDALGDTERGAGGFGHTGTK